MSIVCGVDIKVVLARALSLAILALSMMSLGLVSNSATAIHILSYYLYYDDVKIAYVEVLRGDNVQVNVVPLIQELSPWLINSIRKLVIMPSEYRFTVDSVEELTSIIGPNIEITEKNANEIIVKYRVGNVNRLSIYVNGILTYEENRVGNHVLVLKFIATIDSGMQNLALFETVPLALLILILATYAYFKREELRIL